MTDPLGTVLLGENETVFQWILTMVVGFIVARFVVYTLKLDERLETWAGWVRVTFNIP